MYQLELGVDKCGKRAYWAPLFGHEARTFQCQLWIGAWL